VLITGNASACSLAVGCSVVVFFVFFLILKGNEVKSLFVLMSKGMFKLSDLISCRYHLICFPDKPTLF